MVKACCRRTDKDGRFLLIQGACYNTKWKKTATVLEYMLRGEVKLSAGSSNEVSKVLK